ncbi:STAS domain-containing protein [Bdellovibrio svalbardensis]|uniref:STAS domain-containing protein n=1 Tax=Bdellovibrio svalbardensis TaxID=2972972 RepID=A0ABT6DI97_9BACT|nr:STAS domain-containing protein [Bdellovibrio svalbardensis]MDG0816523.1 STAS domain-containing protein [Bdellovibrio svalbardensis]
MEVRILLDGDVAVVSLSGRIEIEKAQSFKTACLQNFKNKKIVFCMKNLNFVGSSGIQSFFGILNDLNAANKMNAKIAGLNPDFQRLFSFTECSNLEVHESVEGALQSFV